MMTFCSPVTTLLLTGFASSVKIKVLTVKMIKLRFHIFTNQRMMPLQFRPSFAYSLQLFHYSGGLWQIAVNERML